MKAISRKLTLVLCTLVMTIGLMVVFTGVASAYAPWNPGRNPDPGDDGLGQYVCMISETGVYYTTLKAALDAHTDGQTIILVANVSERTGIDAGGKAITINMASFSMDLRAETISVGAGQLEIKGGAILSAGAISADSGELTVDARSVNLQEGVTGAAGSTIKITAYLSCEGKLALVVKGAGATAEITGNFDAGTAGNTVDVTGITANDGAKVTVNGNIMIIRASAVYYDGYAVAIRSYGADVTVNGNITSANNCIDAGDGEIIVNGDLNSPLCAVAAYNETVVTINGRITSNSTEWHYFIVVDGAVDSSPSWRVTDLIEDSNTSKPGYLGYTSLEHSTPSYVWVRASFIDNVALTMPAPKAGDPMKLDNIKTETADTEVFLDQWGNRTDGGIMTGTQTYAAGKTYRCFGIIHARNGYTFMSSATVTINGVPVTGYSSIEPDTIEFYCDFTIPDGSINFVDVLPNNWFYNAVRYVSSQKLMIGIGDREFGSKSTLTRAMLVTILYRNAGEPDVSGLENPFTDVPDGQWYTNAVIWAAANGIVNGYGDGKFGTNDPVTKEQMAVIIYRVQQDSGNAPAGKGEGKKFGDTNLLSVWAVEAFNELNIQGVFEDIPDDDFGPQDFAIRAEVASALYRWLDEDAK